MCFKDKCSFLGQRNYCASQLSWILFQRIASSVLYCRRAPNEDISQNTFLCPNIMDSFLKSSSFRLFFCCWQTQRSVPHSQESNFRMWYPSTAVPLKISQQLMSKRIRKGGKILRRERSSGRKIISSYTTFFTNYNYSGTPLIRPPKRGRVKFCSWLLSTNRIEGRGWA